MPDEDEEMLDAEAELERILNEEDDDVDDDAGEDEDEDSQEVEDEKHTQEDAKQQKQRYVTREELRARDDSAAAEKMISKFSGNGDTTETMKELIPTYLDPSTGPSGIKNGIERLKAKAAQIDAAAQKRIDDQVAEARASNAELFRGAPNTEPFRRVEGDDQEKDFEKVATNAPDAKAAETRMLNRSLEGWTGLKLKLPR